MRRFLLAAGLLLAGCEKTDPGTGGPKVLPASPVPYFSSYEAWCAQMAKNQGQCKGDWSGHDPGTSTLGPYRFVTVEFAQMRDGEGPALDVYLELFTPRGAAYYNLGRTRSGRVTTTVMVGQVVDRPGVLEVHSVFRTAPRMSFSDYHSVEYFIDRPSGLGVIEIPMGKLVGDANGGKNEGRVGQAEWLGGKVRLKGAILSDGDWAVSL